jgi:methionyl-tRNA formyltransferase
MEANLVIHSCPNDSIKHWKPPAFFDREPGLKDVAVVVSFKHFLPASLIDKFPAAALNIHPSLLPKYRGAAPIQHALWNGDTQTGVSIIDLHPRQFDSGRIYLQETVDVPTGATYPQMFKVLAERGAEGLVRVLMNLEQHSVNSIPQDISQVSKAPKIRLEDARITFDMTTEQIWRKHAAFGHQAPIFWETNSLTCQIVGLFNSELDPDQLSLPVEDRWSSLAETADAKVPIGTALFRTKKVCNVIWIKVSDGWIGATLFQVASKKRPSSPLEFRNGHLRNKVSGKVNLLQI